jgi:hypothetical protein
VIENAVWIMAGLVSTLVTMEIGWRVAMGQAKRQKMTSGNKSIEVEKVRAQ